MKSKMVDESSQISIDSDTLSFKPIYSLKYPEIFASIGKNNSHTNINFSNNFNIITSKPSTINNQNISQSDIQTNLSNEYILDKSFTYLINETNKSNKSNDKLRNEKSKTIYIDDNEINHFKINNQKTSHNIKINDLLNKTRFFFNSHGLFLDNRKKIDIHDKQFNYKNIKIRKINFQNSKSWNENKQKEKEYFDKKILFRYENYRKKFLVQNQNKILSRIYKKNTNHLFKNTSLVNIRKGKKFSILLPSIPRLLEENNENDHSNDNANKLDNKNNFVNSSKNSKIDFINIAELQEVYRFRYKLDNRFDNKYKRNLFNKYSFDENRNKRKINGYII